LPRDVTNPASAGFFNAYRYYVVQGDTLVDVWPIDARGRL
jgi:hypothetical protein